MSGKKLDNLMKSLSDLQYAYFQTYPLAKPIRFWVWLLFQAHEGLDEYTLPEEDK
jgi:hypothetical protein